MRLLVDGGGQEPADLSDEHLGALCSVPSPQWLRANMVTTLDGAATGGDGLTGSINNPADRWVFHVPREMSDAIVVGAGTARSERYVPVVRPLVVVSRLGVLPQGLAGAEPGSVLMATYRGAEGLAASRRQLGEDNVLVLGEDTVDLTQLRPQLAERGLVHWSARAVRGCSATSSSWGWLMSAVSRRRRQWWGDSTVGSFSDPPSTTPSNYEC